MLGRLLAIVGRQQIEIRRLKDEAKLWKLAAEEWEARYNSTKGESKCANLSKIEQT